MAETINVAGAVTVKLDTGGSIGSRTLETLCAGGLANGSEITLDTHYLDVHTDANGGDEGPPSDIQILGEIARIQLILTSWDTAVEGRMMPRIWGGTNGTPADPGTLIFANNYQFRLVMITANRPMNFPRVVFREPRQINIGTKHSKLILVGTAYESAGGVLWNTTTS